MFSFTTPAWESNDSGDKWHKEVFEGKNVSKGKLPKKTAGKKSNKIQKASSKSKPKNTPELQKIKGRHNTSDLKINNKVRKKNKQRNAQADLKVHGNANQPTKVMVKKERFPLIKSNKVVPLPHPSKTNHKQTQNNNKVIKKKPMLQGKSTQNGLQEMKPQSTGSTKIDIYNLGVSRKSKLKMSLRERMMEKLKSSRFRYLNEQIYTTDGKSACNLFKNDRDAFLAYHDGYQQQASKWPVNPLDVIIKSIKKMPVERIVADMGCGDAKLAESVPQKVHSFDLVAVNDHITECEMSNVPLEKGSVDVVVFCLSLMGTNIQDFVYEANRILKDGGVLKIAEVESRFEKVEIFVKGVEHFGFKSTWKDLSQKLFYFIDFKKIGNCKQKSKLPSISLLPCIYKKR